MSKFIVMPTWLSVLSFAVALFVPLGVGLIADTSGDSGNRPNILRQEYGHYESPHEWLMLPIEPSVYRIDQKHSEESRKFGDMAHRG